MLGILTLTSTFAFTIYILSFEFRKNRIKNKNINKEDTIGAN